MKKIIASLFALIIVISGCSNSSNANVVAGGSTSVEPLMQEMIDDYNAENPDLTPITYDATGSSAGVENTINETYDVGAVSRELSDEELSDNSDLEVSTLAYDGIAVIVNPENQVSDITMEQLQQIYTGEITNWNELGGIDADIAVVSRDSASGTREAFEEIVDFSGELVQTSEESSSNGEVMQKVKDNQYAIGYVSFDYLSNDTKALNIDGVEPTTDNVLNDTYLISRPFNMVYLSSNDNEDAKNFISWIEENKADYVSELGLIGE